MIRVVFCFVCCNSWSPDVVRVRELRGCNKSLSWGADPRSSCWRHRIAPRLRAACPQMYPLEPTISSVLWMVDACGCEAFESGRSRSLSRPFFPFAGRQGKSACGSGAERQEMLFIVHWFLKLYFFVSISCKRQVKRLKWILLVDDLSRKAIAN